jgi:hypothetical protein
VLLRNAEIRKFRLYTLNLILSRVGFEVKARLTDASPIATEIAAQHWQQRSRFRLVRVVPGVADETDDEDAGAQAEVSPDGTPAAG